jgi:hypothetical protein
MQDSGEMCDAAFLKIVNRAIIACAGKFFVKLFWEKFGEVNLFSS